MANPNLNKSLERFLEALESIAASQEKLATLLANVPVETKAEEPEPKKAEPKKAEPKKTEPKKAEPDFPYETLKATFGELVAHGPKGVARAKAVLAEFDVKKAPDLDPSQYEAVNNRALEELDNFEDDSDSDIFE